MRFFDAAKIKVAIVAVGLLASIGAVVAPTSASAVGVGVVLCTNSSTVTVSQPQTDTVVTDSQLVVKGGVTQSSQIEVTLNDVFDSVVPLNLGQTSFETSVHLTPGTHTIKLTAINSCSPGQNGTATLVVTYTPPPERNADGEVVETSGNNVGVLEADTTALGAPRSGLLPEPIQKAIDETLKFLDIGSLHERGRYSELSIVRAGILTLALYFAIFAPLSLLIRKRVVEHFPYIQHRSRTEEGRLRLAGWVIRMAGVALFIACLFL